MRSRQVCYIKRMISNTKKHLFKGLTKKKKKNAIWTKYTTYTILYTTYTILYTIYTIYIIYTCIYFTTMDTYLKSVKKEL